MSGKIVTTLGVMGAGKTERLINTYRAYKSMGINVGIFKPKVDTRVAVEEVRSRSGNTAPAQTIERIDDIYELGGDTLQMVLIDEVQFFEHPDVVNSIVAISLLGIDVYCYGLDLTSDGDTFGRVGDILAVSDEVVKISCICNRCKTRPARHSAYLGGEKDSVVVVGDLDSYEPVCRDCFYAEELNDFLDDKDPVYLIEVGGVAEGFTMELVAKKSSLEEAGYTYEDVLAIDTLEGAANLLEDLGMTEQGGGSYE